MQKYQYLILSLILLIGISYIVFTILNKKKSSMQSMINDESFLEVKGDYQYSSNEIEQRKKQLPDLSQKVLFEDATEPAFNNAYWDNYEDGVYVDPITGDALFSSTHKYKSGTGWPSFYKAIDDNNVTYKEDNTLFTTRTEVSSRGGHLGHIFNDGPQDKGGKRYCLNSAALAFIPKEQMEEKGYGDYLYLFQE